LQCAGDRGADPARPPRSALPGRFRRGDVAAQPARLRPRRHRRAVRRDQTDRPRGHGARDRLMAVVRRQLLPAIVAFVVLTVLTGVAYPLVVTGIAQLAFPGRAVGSLVERNGVVVGSSLIGQRFDGPRWFRPRPSSSGDGYDAMSSSASNLGPTNPELLQEVRKRIRLYRAENGL